MSTKAERWWHVYWDDNRRICKAMFNTKASADICAVKFRLAGLQVMTGSELVPVADHSWGQKLA